MRICAGFTLAMRPTGIWGGIGRLLVAPCAIGLGLVLSAAQHADARQAQAPQVPPDINNIMQQQRQIVQQQEQARRDELERQRQPQAQAPGPAGSARGPDPGAGGALHCGAQVRLRGGRAPEGRRYQEAGSRRENSPANA